MNAFTVSKKLPPISRGGAGMNKAWEPNQRNRDDSTVCESNGQLIFGYHDCSRQRTQFNR